MSGEHPGSGVAQPAGTVTLVFTDIEGSTRLLEELGTDGYRQALAEHRRIVREASARHDGYEVGTEGDSFFMAFASAPAAVSAVAEAVGGLAGGPIRIRVGIHTGEPALDPPNYVGLDVHRAARIMSAAHGGQVVLSRRTVELLDGAAELKDLGDHRFKDFDAAERIYQLGTAEHPPLKSLYRSSLPVPATPFLGREAEVAEVAALLTDASTRVLTLTGPGGTGKTRLAIEAAARAADQFPDGVTWVALAPLRDPALVIPTIAQALEIREHPEQALTDTVAQALLGKRALLLLDNLEHLLPDAALDIALLVSACPSLHVVVTSRERLRINGERTWPVPPLSQTDGERLFLERARAAGVEIDPGETVAALCLQLDELPLAIELAAARTRLLSPAAILGRLDRRLAVLATRDHDVDERQRTLDAAIGWSYDLLEPDEQRALRALSIFAGGCTLDAAERVAGAGLDLIESLLDRSLLRHRVDDAGEDRYWMLETIREYADDRLVEAQELEPRFDAFVAWLADIVGEVDEPWIDRDQLEWLRTLERERANLMHAITTSLARGLPDIALRLVAAADQFIDARGPIAHFVELLDGVRCGDPLLDGRTSLLRIRLLGRMGYHAEVKTAVEAQDGAARADPSLEGRLLSLRAFNLLFVGDAEVAATHAVRSVALTRQADDPLGVAEALICLGLAETTRGRIDAGLAHLRESEHISTVLGDTRNAQTARINIGITLLADRRPEEAGPLLRDVLRAVRRIDDPVFLSITLVNLAIALSAVGERTSARTAIREAVELESIQFDESVRRESLLALAIDATHQAAPELAITLWAAGARLGEGIEYPVGPELRVYVADRLEPLRRRPDFELHWARGRSLPAEEAIALGLGDAPRADERSGAERPPTEAAESR